MTANLTTKYLGLKLENPLIVGACPLTGQLDVLRQLADLGAAAAVMPSMFEEQLRGQSGARDSDTARHASPIEWESTSYCFELQDYNRGPDAYLGYLAAAKAAVSIPIFASLNVTGPGSAVQFARRIEETGVDALELNIYFLATDFDAGGAEVEARYVEIVEAVRRAISIPLAVKLGPYFTSLPNVARRLVAAGANGLVLFNRFVQPEIDLREMRPLPRLTLSNRDELRLALRWVGLLHGRLDASLAATGGIQTADDVIKSILAGADVAMVASTLYREGIKAISPLIEGTRQWMEANDYASLDQVRGILSHRNCFDPEAYERANYTKAISSFVGAPAESGR